ncbi:hypothetical protein [Chitinimonas sp.]|uniref:hypothetical protein n=1 Tax=Chitinimonas sp. TaxID=1934313 RepID=UPI0035B1DF9F
MKYQAAFFMLCSMGLLAIAQPVAAEMVVVAGAKSPLGSLNKDQLIEIYLSKVKNLSGVAVQPSLPASGAVREVFLSQVLGKSDAQARAYWAKLAFTGRGGPPREVSNQDELLQQLQRDPGMLAVMEKSANSELKVLFSLP